MPKVTAKREAIRVRTLNGGQNSSAEPTVAGANEATLLQDSTITNLGQTKQRGGLTRTGDNPDTLISRWTFDLSTSVDDKGSNDGVGTNITYVDGKFGKAASFNGTTSSIKVDADTTIDVNSMGPFRISAWVYVDSDGENDIGSIIDKFDTAGYKLWVHTESSSTVKLSFQVGDTGADALAVTSTTMSTEVWHKIDATYDSSRVPTIWIDGVEASYGTQTTGGTATSDDSAVDLYIGNNVAGSATFDGEIDDARVWDGAFTVQDIELDKIMGITHYDVGSTVDRVYRIKNTDLQNLDDDFKKWTDIDTGFTADLTTNFVQANDLLFILNGTDNVHTMDSSEAVTDEGNTNTDPPKTTFGDWAANNRLFLSGSLTDSERDDVWFSNTLAPQTFVRDTNRFRVAKGQGGKIIWIKGFKEFEMIIYKQTRIYVLNMDGTTPLTDWDVKPLSVVVGCPAGRTVHDIGNDHIFLANDGVRLLSRTSFDKLRVGVISEKIQDIIDDINQDAIQNSVAHFENEKYLLGVPTGTSTIPNKFVIWDAQASARNGDPNSGWSVVKDDAWKISCMTAFGFGDNKLTVVGGSAEALSLCYKINSGNTDDGTTINQTINGLDHDFGDRVASKISDPLQVVAETGSDGIYSVQIEKDREGFSTIGQINLSGALQTPFTTPATTGGTERKEEVFRTKFIGRGKIFRVRLQNTAHGKQPTFTEYTLFSDKKSWRVG